MAKKIDVNGLSHYHDKVSAMLASEYSSSKTYAVGDYCFHAGTLYECTTAITTAEAWTSGHWTAAKLAEDTSALKTALNEQTLEYRDSYNFNIEWTPDYIFNKNGEIIADSGSAYCETYFPVLANDIIATNLSSTSSKASFIFYDAMLNFVDYVQQVSDYKNIKITVPNNTAIRFVRVATTYYNDTTKFKYSAPFAKFVSNNDVLSDLDEVNYAISTAVANVTYKYDLEWETGKIILTSSGYTTNNTSGAYTPNYYRINANDKIALNAKCSGGASAIAYYDKYYQFISGVEKADYKTQIVTVPNNSSIYYVRFSAEKYNDNSYYSENVFVKHLGEINPADTDSILSRLAYKESVENENNVFVQKQFDLDSASFSTIHASVANVENALEIICADSGNSSHRAYINLTSNPIDLSRACIGIDLDVIGGTEEQADYYANISEIQLVLSSETTFNDSTVARYIIVANSAYVLYAGNYKTTVYLDIQRSGSSINVDLSSVKMIGIQITTKSPFTGLPKVRVNNLFACGINKRKQVVIGFDGNYKAQLEAASYLDSLGLSGTFYISNATIDTTNSDDADRMNLSDLIGLQEKNHLVANYCSGYGAWYELSLAQKKTAIVENAEWLYAHGFGEGATSISVPSGGYSADDAQLYTDNYAKTLTGRIVVSSQPKPSGFYESNPFGHSVGPNGTNATRFASIESMIKYGGVCVFIFHRCNGSSDDITLDTFKEFADYVASKRNAGLLEVVTADKLKTNYTLSYPVGIT